MAGHCFRNHGCLCLHQHRLVSHLFFSYFYLESFPFCCCRANSEPKHQQTPSHPVLQCSPTEKEEEGGGKKKKKEIKLSL